MPALLTSRDSARAYEFWLDSPIFGVKRRCCGPRDFGDEATIGKHLRRLKGHEKTREEGDFGVYLGPHPEGFVVLLKRDDNCGPLGYEVYPDLGDLQREWELD